MSFLFGAAGRFSILVLILVPLAFSGCASEARDNPSRPATMSASSGSRSVAFSMRTPSRRISSVSELRKGLRAANDRIQGNFAIEVDATSAATEEGSSGSTDAVSGATGEDTIKDADYCLKCHGPFEKLAGQTEDYITEWDEKANPHIFVPHDSTTITECAECHDPHELPFRQVEGSREPNVDYCYSCHHAETLVNCNECHNE